LPRAARLALWLVVIGVAVFLLVQNYLQDVLRALAQPCAKKTV